MKKILFLILLPFLLSAQSVWYVNFNNSSGTYNGLTSATGWNFFDSNDGYYARETGVNWSLISAGDTILVSGTYRPNNGYGVMIDGANISGGYVYIKEDWHSGYGNAEFRNSDTLVTIAPFTSSEVENNVLISNSTGLYFIGLDFIVDEPRPSYTGTRSITLVLESDSLIYFDKCNFTSNGIAGVIGFTRPNNIVFDSCVIQNEYNYFTEDNDIFTWSQEGRGEVTIKDCQIINRDAYTGFSDNGANMTATSNSLTDTDLNMPIDYHKHATILCGGSEFTILSNNATTFTGFWTGSVPANGTAYTVASSAHRDIMQMGFDGVASPRPTTKFIRNHIWTLYSDNANSWNQGHYMGDVIEHISYQNFVYISNLFVFTPQMNNSGNVNIVSQNWPNPSSRAKFEFYGNTFITPGGIFISQAVDTFYFKNNIFKVIGGGTNYRLLRNDRVSVDSINHNYYSVDGWVDNTYANGGTVMLWDNYNEYTWSNWQSAGFDVNSSRDIVGNLYDGIIDSTISAYATPLSNDFVGADLSYLAGKYPDIMYWIDGTERSTWYMGAINPIGATPPDSLPDAFTLADASNAELNTLYFAQTGDLTGFDSAYVHIDRGQYNVNGGAWKNSNEWTKVFPLNDVYVRDTSSSSYSTAKSVVLTIGNRSDTFTITTKDSTGLTNLKPFTVDGRLLIEANGNILYAGASGTVQIDTIPPSPPTSFTAIGGTSSTQFNNTWVNPNDTDLDSIRYYEGSSNDTTTMSLVATFLAGSGSYLRSGRTANTTYWCAVKAVDDSGNVSYFSNTDSATTLASESGQPLQNLNMVYLTQSFGQHLYNHSTVGSAGTTTMQDEITYYNESNPLAGANACTIYRPLADYPACGDMIWDWNQVFYGGTAFSNTENIVSEYIATDTTYSIIQVVFGFNSGGMVNDIGLDTVTYPAGHIVENYKYWIRNMVSTMELYPDKYFILWNIPPVTVGSGNSQSEVNVQADFNLWMTDTLQAGLDSYGAFPNNIYVFDIFTLLKNGSNYMNASYADASDDSHPNASASSYVAPIYIQRAFDHARAYRRP